MNDELPAPVDPGEFVLYQADDGATRVQVRLQDGTVWLSQRAMAELYRTSVPNINQHLAAVYEDGEQVPEATIKSFLIVQAEGARRVRRVVEHYSLPAILAVGYRVTHVGKISQELAVARAEAEFDRFAAARRAVEASEPSSDFDRVVEQARALEKKDGSA